MATVLVAYPTVEAGRLTGLLVATGGIGLASLAVGVLARWPLLIALWPLPLLAEYGMSLLGRPAVDPTAVLYAGGLAATSELALTAIEPEVAVLDHTRRRLLRLASTVTASVAIAALLLATAALPLPQGILVQAAGVGSAAGLIALVAVLLRRRGEPHGG